MTNEICCLNLKKSKKNWRKKLDFQPNCNKLYNFDYNNQTESFIFIQIFIDYNNFFLIHYIKYT